MDKFWEENYPWIISLVLAPTLAWALNWDLQAYKQIIEVAITVSSVAIGFIGAIASVFLTLRTRVINFLIRVGKFSTVYVYFWSAIKWSAVFLAYSLVVMMIDGDQAGSGSSTVVALLWFFLGCLAFAASYRSLRVSVRLLLEVAKDMEDEGDEKKKEEKTRIKRGAM